MPEELSEELKAHARGFADALPASVVMPAGAGKTHLLAATAKHVVTAGGNVLVLTHTNAGVFAINKRLKRFGVTKGVRTSTITSFAFRLARSYPVLGKLLVPKLMNPQFSKDYIRAATRVASGLHIKAVLAASFSHILVDEYQDCSDDHHAFVLKLKDAVPTTGILGDPLQAIFGFADFLPDWDDVLTSFPAYGGIEAKPRRWIGHNEGLGEWLEKVRDYIEPGRVLNLKNPRYPAGVRFTNIAGNPSGVTAAARAALPLPPEESVLIIASQAGIARDIAGNLNGTYTVMEEVAGKFMATALGALITSEPVGYASWLFGFTKSCYCNHGLLDPSPLGKRYAEGRTGTDLLATNSKRAGAEPAIRAFDQIVARPTLANLVTAMDTIPTSPGLRLHSHEAWYDVKTAIKGASVKGDDKAVLLEELAKVRDVLRYTGRRERMRIVSRTLLVKGLEYDHVIIADVANHTEINDLYVALTRARKTIRILGRTDSITLKPSPNGPRR